MRRMDRTVSAILVISLFLGFVGTTSAASIPVILSTPGAEDYAFGPNGILYISTSSGAIDRYNTLTNTTLSPFNIGGSLLGMDISRDGTTLAVADTTRTGFDLVSTATGAVTPVSYTPSILEAGGFSVAYESNGKVLFSTQLNGSGFVALRQYDPSTGQTTTIANPAENNQFRQNSMLWASADRTMVGIAEFNQTGGPIHAYSVASGSLAATNSLPNGIGANTMVPNANGTQYAVPTFEGTYIYNLTGSSLVQKTILGVDGNTPNYVVYSPNDHYLFAANGDNSGKNSGILVYDTNTWTVAATLSNVSLSTNYNAFQAGWMRISPDGTLLAVNFGSTTELFNVSAFATVPEPSGMILGLTAIGLVGLVSACRKRYVWAEQRPSSKSEVLRGQGLARTGKSPS